MSTLNPSATPERDDVYYFDLVTLKIEDTLFRIPRSILISNSPIFQDMFAVPQGEGGTTQVEGSCDTNPITLDHVKKDDFRHLLHLILRLNFPPSEPVLTKEACTAVLALADKWEMNKIRIHCIGKLTSTHMSAIERIGLGKKFHVPQWLRTAYKELVDQDKPLSMSDSSNIGYRSAIGVFQLREQRYQRERNRSLAESLTIENVFKDELAEEETIFKTYGAPATIFQPYYRNAFFGY